jgi:hypothetical protein
VESQAIYVEVFVRGTSTIWWGDTQRDTGRESISHTYKEVSTHNICVEPYDQLTEIRIINGFLVGPVPDFSDFGEITLINLNINQLSGTLPPEIGNLSNLRHLNIRDNQLSGTLPPEIGNLSSLQTLNIRFNNFTGTIPAELGNLSNLQNLRLNDCQFSGAIPAGIAAIPALLTIGLQENDFSQADMSAFVDALYANRTTLGSNGCLIDISNNNGITATAADQIEGTGSYAGDGLVQAGCNVLY